MEGNWLGDAENWLDRKPKKKTKILLEGWMEGNWLADAEIWRDLKTQKKN